MLRGGNITGELGFGDTQRRYVFTKVPGINNVKSIATGNGYSLLLMNSGEVYAVGYNSYGKLGLGDTSDRHTFTKVPGINNVKSIAACWDHSLLLTNVGEVYAVGYNSYGELGLGDTQERHTFTKVPVPSVSRVKSITIAASHSLILTESGDIYASGNNNYGRLGLGNNSNKEYHTFQKVSIPH